VKNPQSGTNHQRGTRYKVKNPQSGTNHQRGTRRKLIPGIRARTTAAGTLGGRYRDGGHVHTWTPKAQEFDRTAQPTDAPWCHPFTGKETYLSSTYQGVISGFTNKARCKRELGLITGGAVWAPDWDGCERLRRASQAEEKHPPRDRARRPVPTCRDDEAQQGVRPPRP
jgi:hypothetical protein